MLNSLLDILPGTGDQNPNNYYFSNAGEPFVYALIGFLIVFAGIVIIIGIIWLIGFIMRKTNNLAAISEFFEKRKERKEKPADQQTSEAAKDLTVSEDGGDIPDEVKAAIVAAIMAYYVEEKPHCEFKVKRIKRI